MQTCWKYHISVVLSSPLWITADFVHSSIIVNKLLGFVIFVSQSEAYEKGTLNSEEDFNKNFFLTFSVLSNEQKIDV